MVLPSRGCSTCKQRRVKCDGARPVCRRCLKANRICHGVAEAFLFLNENEYAVGRRRRPRGPNVKAILANQDSPQNAILGISQSLFDEPINALAVQKGSPKLNASFVSASLNAPLMDHALAYWSHNYVDAPQDLNGYMDGHLKYAFSDHCYTQPQSILSLAILAVSHATFGRARRSRSALAVGCTKYSKAIEKTNLSLKDSSQALRDDVLLAIMFLSFYENSVAEVASHISGRNIQVKGARSFTHADGAMAILQLRRRVERDDNCTEEVDMLVRRQLLRALLLRHMSVPSWLEDGSQYGESGFVLGLDHLMVKTANLRSQASTLLEDTAAYGIPNHNAPWSNPLQLFTSAQSLDDALILWADELPSDSWYVPHNVIGRAHDQTNEWIIDGIAHFYPSVSHAGMWNRYRALRLATNDVILKALSAISESSDLDTRSLKDAAKQRIEVLAGDLCASVPYMLGLIDPHHVPQIDEIVAFKAPLSLKETIKASTASFLCWPLAMASTVPAIPERHQSYLRNRLLDVSELVDDSVLVRVAGGFSVASPSASGT